MKIMFICTGNICRSAMAHRMLEKRVKDLNRDDIEVYSCGVFAYNGDRPTSQGIEVMKNYEVDLTSHRATNIHNSNIEDMDIIFTEGLFVLLTLNYFLNGIVKSFFFLFWT